MPDELTLEEAEAQKHDESAISAILDEVPEPETQPAGNVVVQPPTEKGANRDIEPEPTLDQPAPPASTPPADPSSSPKAGESGHEAVQEVAEVALVESGKLKTEAELEAELEAIQPPKGAHPNVKKGISAMKDKLREELKNARTVVENANKKVKESEDKLATIKPLDEPTEKELTALREFRTTFGIQQEITGRYEPQIKAVADEALGLLKTWGLPEPVEKFIADHGGVVKMRYSPDPMPDGSMTQAEWFKKEIWGKISTDLQKEELDDRIRSARQLERTRNNEIKEAQKKPEDYVKARNKEIEDGNKAWDERATTLRTQMVQRLGNAANKIEIKTDMPTEEKAYAEKHNDRIDRATKLYDDLIHNFTPEGEAVKAMGSAQALYLSEYAKDLETEIAAIKKERDQLKEQVGKIKNSGRTAKQSNAPLEAPKSTIPDIKLTDEQAIDKMFKEIDTKNR
jgi:hypothetical protein